MSGRGVDGGGGNQGAVETEERSAVGMLFGEGLVEVGCVVGDHVQCLVEVAVAGGLRQAMVTRQAVDGGRITHPATEQDRLGPASGGSLPGTPVMSTSVGRQPRCDAAHDGLGKVKDGTIRQHAGSDSGGRWVSWQKPILHHPTRMHPPESTTTPCQSITADVLQAALMRKPHSWNIGIEMPQFHFFSMSLEASEVPPIS
ncbi:hypothetical protein GCM10027030_11090 [Luteococcus sediminum]